MAAEETGRSAFLLERVPEYCNLIIRRWETLTGSKGRLIKWTSEQSVMPNLPLALCLEERDIWQAVGLTHQIGRCNCVL